MYLRVICVIFSRHGGWYPVPHDVQGDAGTSYIIGDQVLFCTDADAIVTLASHVDGMRTVTSLYNWCRPLCVT
jgi:hypothetical protein